ncbi:hypothetical protein [Ensifer sp. ENS04]|uniref:hypothetical protein n=1 Tax=Ensifer sp. ENS04 TaxID=2769281 RepID=UPI00177D8BEA|nr:hypothetical protein [Ensifer sp. ENS04]
MPRFVEDRDAWVKAVVQSHELPHLAARVGVHLAMQMDPQHREVTATMEEIAQAVHASERGVLTALSLLEEQGYLGIERKRHKGNRYWMLKHPLIFTAITAIVAVMDCNDYSYLGNRHIVEPAAILYACYS